MSCAPIQPPKTKPVKTGPAPRAVAGISALAPDYDGFILDLWGVVHDGVKPFPGTVDCLRRLRAQAKKVVFLSNAPRRTGPIADSLARMGIDHGLYDHIVSSGEETRRALLERSDPWYAALGRRCYHIGPKRDWNIREGLDFDFVAEVAAADFILNTGPWDFDETLADFEDMLEAAARRALPMICANPDVEVIRAARRVLCAGALAKRYEELGGDVRYHGKPFAPVYRRCLDLMAIADRRRILAVGDSLRTDIAGADGAGLDSVLVLGGLHGDEMGLAPGALPGMDRLARDCAAAGHLPMAAMAALSW